MNAAHSPSSRRPVPWLLAGLLLAGCGDDPPATTPPAGAADRLLVVDGVEIKLGEVEPLVAWLHSIAPEWSRKALVRRMLEEHVLPLRMAERAFPEQRRKQLALAEALRSVSTNVEELEQQSKLLFQQRKVVSRRQVEPPVSIFVFDPLQAGAVSDPIPVPRGFIVAGCYEVKQSALVVDDLADALQVGFLTHTAAEWTLWLEAEQRRIADKVTYVHPDYREAMPLWLQLP